MASGAASLGGRRPANTSGGLVSKGHPLAASGLAMTHELVTQLRGEAGSAGRKPKGGPIENGGGMRGLMRPHVVWRFCSDDPSVEETVAV